MRVQFTHDWCQIVARLCGYICQACMQSMPWCVQRHAAAVHKHHLLRRIWSAWQAFMHSRWHKRAQLNAALRQEHDSVTWRAFSHWQQRWREYHCWLAAQQHRRLRHHLQRWRQTRCNVQSFLRWVLSQDMPVDCHLPDHSCFA